MPAPAASGLAVDSLEGGDVSVQLSLGARPGAPRRLLYAGHQIESLELSLLWLNNGTATPTEKHLVTLSQADLLTSPTLTFSKLKRGRDYRVVATAWATLDGVRTIINDVSLSRLGFSIDANQVMSPALLGDLPVVLNDTPIYAADATLGVSTGAGLVEPALTVGVAANDVTHVALTFDGTVAKVDWTSAKSSLADYDVQLVDAATGTTVVADATGVDREDGTAHQRTFEMGTAALGNYVAKVRIKGRAEHVSSAAAFARHVATVALSFSGTTATVAWTSLTATAADYDIQLLDAGGTVVAQDAATDSRTGTSHTATLSVTGQPYQAYTAKVRLKDRPLSEHTGAAYRVNAVSAVTLGITGATATIGWTSAAGEATDYDVYLVDAATGDTVVLTDEATAAVTGTTHTTTLDLSDLPLGSYKARVVNKGVPGSAAVSAAAASLANTVANVVLVYEGKSAKVTWESGIAAATDYDVEILDATDAVIKSDTATATTTGTEHAATISLSGVSGGSYRARVTIKGDAASAVVSGAETYVSLVEPITTPQLTMSSAGRSATVTFTTNSPVERTYSYKFYQLALPNTTLASVEAVHGPFEATSTGPARSFVLGVNQTTPVFAFNKNYIVEVFEDGESLGVSNVSYYNEFGDPITGECTVGPSPTCTFF
jgi:hypothetical protein